MCLISLFRTPSPTPLFCFCLLLFLLGFSSFKLFSFLFRFHLLFSVLIFLSSCSWYSLSSLIYFTVFSLSLPCSSLFSSLFYSNLSGRSFIFRFYIHIFLSLLIHFFIVTLFPSISQPSLIFSCFPLSLLFLIFSISIFSLPSLILLFSVAQLPSFAIHVYFPSLYSLAFTLPSLFSIPPRPGSPKHNPRLMESCFRACFRHASDSCAPYDPECT